MSETNVAELFAERTSDTEVAANFAYLNNISNRQQEQKVLENPPTHETLNTVSEPQDPMANVVSFGIGVGDNVGLMRQKAMHNAA